MDEETAGPALARRELLVLAAGVMAGAVVQPRRAAGEVSASRAAAPPASAPAASAPSAADLQPGSVIGRALYVGTPPVPEPVDCSADPQCALLYRKKPLTRETILVAPDGSLRNVFVSVVKGLPQDARWPIPDRPVVLDQKGCRYLPHVFAVRAGQPLEILNSSKIHEVPHGYPQLNPEFSFSLPKKGMKKTVVLNEPETFKIKCDVHPWETAWCHVMAHPFYAVSDAAGRFVLQGLAPGEYELEFWHEHWSLGLQTRTVRVKSDGPILLDDVQFEPRERREDVTAETQAAMTSPLRSGS